MERGVVFSLGGRARQGATGAVVVWAVVTAVVLFMLEAHVGPRRGAEWVGCFATALLGGYLGWRRRVGAVFFAPLVSWFFSWPLLLIAAMIHDGPVSGFFVGLFLITIGWVAVGAVELIWLGAVALVVRALRGQRTPRDPSVVVYGPGER